jgi:hypothetical protein
LSKKDEAYVIMFDQKTWKWLSAQWLSLYLMEIKATRQTNCLLFYLSEWCERHCYTHLECVWWKNYSALSSVAQTVPSMCRLYSRVCIHTLCHMKAQHIWAPTLVRPWWNAELLLLRNSGR